jgi:hypothetical protein
MLRAPHAAGEFGLTIVPAGASMSIGSNKPAFGGSSGSSSAFTA